MWQECQQPGLVQADSKPATFQRVWREAQVL